MATKIITADADLAILRAYAEAKAVAAEAVKAEADAKAAVVALLGDAVEATVDGATVVTYAPVESSRFDVTAFRKAHADVYAQWLVSNVSPRFLWKGIAS